MPSPISDLPMFEQNPGIFAQIRNAFIRFRMCSEISNSARLHVTSQKKIEEERRNHLKYLYIIHPYSDLRRCWEALMIIVLLLVFVMFPIDICFYDVRMFENFTKKPMWRITKLVADIICLLDVLMLFFTGYRDKKKRIIVMEPKKVFVNYLSTFFVFDFVSSIPNNLAYRSFDSYSIEDTYWKIDKVLMYLSICKIFRLRTFVVYCNNSATSFNITYSTHSAKVMMLLYVLYYHLTTCVSIYIVTWDIPFDQFEYVLFNKSRKHMQYNLQFNVETTYVYILYQTCSVINNSNYLVANAGRYMITSIVIWLISRLLYMCFMAVLLRLIECRTIAKHKYDELTNELAEYMKHNQLPVYLQRRIWTYFEFQFQKSYFREDKVLNSVSNTLGQEIQMHSCKKLVENVYFFRDLPMSFLMNIVTVLHHEIFMINDVIVKANTYGDCMYFLATGTVAVYTNTGEEICHLTDGNHFGEVALVVRNEKRIASVVAIECSEMYRLDRKDFIRALMPYPDLLSKIQYIAQERKEETHNIDDRYAKQAATMQD